jgi:hypothetical protein
MFTSGFGQQKYKKNREIESTIHFWIKWDMFFFQWDLIDISLGIEFLAHHGIIRISKGDPPEKLKKNAVFVLLRVGKKPPPSMVFFREFLL